MRLSRAPDLGAPVRMMIAAVVATLIAVVILSFRDGPSLVYGLGDTDDAMRMVLVRDLLAGASWYDQLVERLQPPLGLQMHWSRLIDGGMAAMMALFGLFAPAAQAEHATRFVWPMLWILPAAISVLAVTRRLGGGAAVFACAILLLTDLSLYMQFRPGRIDHHGLQIALCLVAFAGAALGGVRAAALSGAAIGLGLSVGLEALAFEVAVAAYFPIAFLCGRDPGGKRLLAFAAAIGAATLGAYLVQTPPWRWAIPACDAIAVNLVGGVVTGAVGLALTARLTHERDWRWRFGALALSAMAAAAAYVGLNPHCLAGPFADVDPRIKTFWLQYVQEIRSVPRVWAREHATPITLMAPAVMGAVAWIWLGVDRPRRADPFWILAGLVLFMAAFAGFSAIRMATYANWVAVPIIAAAVTDLVNRYAKGAMVVLAVAALAATPLFAASGVIALDKRTGVFGRPEGWKPPAKAAPRPAAKAARRPPPGPRGDRCFQLVSYREFSKLPAGLAIAEIDLGPFVLAYTPSSAMAAPYHRMNWGMLTARDVMAAEAGAAEAKARKLGASYVLQCPHHRRNADRVGMASTSLQKRLDRNDPPPWLELVPTSGALKVYRLRQAGAGSAERPPGA